MISESEISLLHSCWCKLTGQNLRMNSLFDTRRLAWQHFAAAGHTVHELETVVLHLKNGIRDGNRLPGCLRFSNLIENVPGFEEELELARAEKRNTKPAPSAKEAVIQQWRQTVSSAVEVCTARQVGEIMAQGFEAMRQAANGQ